MAKQKTYDKPMKATITIKIDAEGNGEKEFTIPCGWESGHGEVPQAARHFYLKSKDTKEEFPRSYYIKTLRKKDDKGIEQGEAKDEIVDSKVDGYFTDTTPRIRALMLKVAKDDVRDGEEESTNAVILGEELKWLENKGDVEDKICECEARV